MTQSSPSTPPISPNTPSSTDPTVPIETIPDADEHLQVLRLLENGEITADEAGHLLDALDADPEPDPVNWTGPTSSTAAGPVGRGRGTGTGTRENGQSGPHRDGAGSAKLPPPRLRIRVSDTTSGKARVNITIPLGFLDAGYRLVRRIVPDRVPDRDAFQSAIRDGFRGHLIDVNEGNEHVEILVE